MIRWRYKVDAEGKRTGQIESNARLVTWSDGSQQIFLGKEVYDVKESTLDNSDGQNSMYADLRWGAQDSEIDDAVAL